MNFPLILLYRSLRGGRRASSAPRVIGLPRESAHARLVGGPALAPYPRLF